MLVKQKDAAVCWQHLETIHDIINCKNLDSVNQDSLGFICDIKLQILINMLQQII